MKFRSRLFGVLALLSLAWICYGMFTASSVASNMLSATVTPAGNLDAETARAARASVRSRQSLDAARQLQDVLSQLDVFWAKTDTEINQVLHAIFGEYKLIVRGGRIVAITRP